MPTDTSTALNFLHPYKSHCTSHIHLHLFSFFNSPHLTSLSLSLAFAPLRFHSFHSVSLSISHAFLSLSVLNHSPHRFRNLFLSCSLSIFWCIHIQLANWILAVLSLSFWHERAVFNPVSIPRYCAPFIGCEPKQPGQHFYRALSLTAGPANANIMLKPTALLYHVSGSLFIAVLFWWTAYYKGFSGSYPSFRAVRYERSFLYFVRIYGEF